MPFVALLLVGMVTQADLTRFQALSSAQFVRDAATAESVSDLAAVTARIPQPLVRLVGAHTAHQVITRLITDFADTVTRRLLTLAEVEFGALPVPYLWLACGSQGRHEQTGVSDQDNGMILSDHATVDDMAYFARLARFVSDGLDACGYVYCPGDMMRPTRAGASLYGCGRNTSRAGLNSPIPWRRCAPRSCSICGRSGVIPRCFATFRTKRRSLKHAPPLGLLRGTATIRSGEHKNHIDQKHNGVVPVTDLGRVYALVGRLRLANTRKRLEAAEAAGIISASGGRDLIEAYDLIAACRLFNQAEQIRRGEKPDSILELASLSDLERPYLRDVFVVLRAMQSAVGQSCGARS